MEIDKIKQIEEILVIKIEEFKKKASVRLLADDIWISYQTIYNFLSYRSKKTNKISKWTIWEL